MTRTWIILLLLLAWLAVPAFCLAADKEAKLIDPDTLKSKLGDPQVLIIDVRVPSAWAGSDSKIKGAIRQDPDRVNTWRPALPKDKKIVLYCS
jgi:rhodanese-related sulfurtransferase